MKKLLLSVAILVLVPFVLFAQQQTQNPGFEEWEEIISIGLEEPVEWSSIKTSDNEILNPVEP